MAKIKGKKRLPSKAKIRSLVQYRSMTEEEFEKMWEEKYASRINDDGEDDIEARIDARLEEFAQDYDIDDLKINDRIILRQLVQAMIQLEDYERSSAEIREGGLDVNNITMLRELNGMMATLRKDISSMQADLSISRRIRKGDKETSVLNYLEDLKQKAKVFYQSKMSYMWCPKCGMLLGTAWFMYPDEKNNKLQLVCNRTLETGEKCSGRVLISSKELMEKRGINKDDAPEFFK